MMLGHVEGVVKRMLQIINFKARLVVVFDCFNYWEFSLIDPVH